MALTYHCFHTIRLTSTPGSILKLVISFTLLEGQQISMTLLWIRISNLSQVFEPSPQGVFLVVMCKILVGMRTGPLVSNVYALALDTISAHAFSNGLTSLLLSVILILWISSCTSSPLVLSFSVSILCFYLNLN